MDKNRSPVIVSAFAFAETACEYFDASTYYEVVVFAVKRPCLKRDTLLGWPVRAFDELPALHPCADRDAFVAITYAQLNRLRALRSREARGPGYTLASYVSPRAFVWRKVQSGEHCFIFGDNTVQPLVRLGDDVVLWRDKHIGHRSIVDDHCFVSPHVVVSGFCRIGAYSFLGVNATVANNVAVGRDNGVGPNTVLMKDTADGALFRADQPELARLSAPRFFKVAA